MNARDQARKPEILSRLRSIAAELSGFPESDLVESATFLQLGFDSLFMTQLAASFQEAFATRLTFRQLFDELPTLDAVAGYIDSRMPAPLPATSTLPAAQAAGAASGPAAATGGEAASAIAAPAAADVLQAVILQQLDLMSRQLEQMRAASAGGSLAASSPAALLQAPAAAHADATQPAQATPALPALNEAEQKHLERLVARYQAMTAKASRFRLDAESADSRSADAPGASLWRSLDYPVPLQRVQGAYLFDIDGNRYIDLDCGSGADVLGQQALAELAAMSVAGGVADDLQAQLAKAGNLLRDFIGCDQVRWLPSGKAALEAACRLARSATGRRTVISTVADAGQADHQCEIGGVMEALAARAQDAAAVLVDPFLAGDEPADANSLLADLRRATREAGAVLIFDARASGFRLPRGGAATTFGVSPDLSVLGGFLGAGTSIGALAGGAAMQPSTDRHLALAAGCIPMPAGMRPGAGQVSVDGGLPPSTIRALLKFLERLQAEDKDLPERLDLLASRLHASLDRCFEAHGATLRVKRLASRLRLSCDAGATVDLLLHWHLRLRGVHLPQAAPFFIGAAHTDKDVAAVAAAFDDALHEMQADGILASSPAGSATAAWRRALPTTEAQRGLWYASQMNELASCAFNESDAIRIGGPLDAALLADAVAQALARHEAFSLRFSPDGQSQWIDPAGAFSVEQSDFSSLQPQQADARLSALVSVQALKAFDLEKGPLVRAHLAKMAPDAHVLLLYFHHLVFDGYSGNLLMQDIATIYNARTRGESPVLGPVTPFSLYVYRAQLRRQQGEVARCLSYWQSAFAQSPPSPLELPTDRPRGAVRSYAGATAHREFDAAMLDRLRATARSTGTTMSNLLLAAFQALLGRLGDQDDLVVGIPAAGQAHLELETVGYCVNALPIRSRPSAGKSFGTLVAETQRAVLDALEHQDATLGAIARSLRLPSLRSRLPLVEVMFNFSAYLSHLALDGCTVIAHENRRRATFYDMFLHVVETDGRLVLDWDYRTDLFDAETLERWLDQYQETLEALARQPRLLIGELPTGSAVHA